MCGHSPTERTTNQVAQIQSKTNGFHFHKVSSFWYSIQVWCGVVHGVYCISGLLLRANTQTHTHTRTPRSCTNKKIKKQIVHMHTSLIKLCVDTAETYTECRAARILSSQICTTSVFFSSPKMVLLWLLARRILHFWISIWRKLELEIGFCTHSCSQFAMQNSYTYPRFDRWNSILSRWQNLHPTFSACVCVFLCMENGKSFWANAVEYHSNK